MTISVVIPTLNRAPSLALTLQSLIAQQYPAGLWDVLVADNGSTDNTREVTEAVIRGNTGLNLGYVYEPVPGLLSGRHRGAMETRGDILVFIDDDIDAHPGWLAAVARAFEDPAVHLVGGRNLPRYEVSPPAWLDEFWEPTPYGGRMCGWLSLLDLGDRTMDVDPGYVWGLNFAIRRQTLLEAGGFHPDCIDKSLQHWQGDGETGLSDKLRAAGRRAVYQPDAVVYHRTPASRLTVEYFENRAFYQGVCDSYSHIRSQGGLRKPWSIGHWIGALRRGLRSVFNAAAASQIRRRVDAAYAAGYAFHQTAAQSNPAVLAWVLRADYWDYQLPGPGGT